MIKNTIPITIAPIETITSVSIVIPVMEDIVFKTTGEIIPIKPRRIKTKPDA